MTLAVMTPEKWARFTPEQERAAIAWLARHDLDHRDVFKIECVSGWVYVHVYELDEQSRKHLCPGGCGCVAQRQVEIDATDDAPPWIETAPTAARQ